MKSQTQTCQNCKQNFVIEPDDLIFYERIKVPPPTWCPECRLIRRFTARNERGLYKRKCDLCQKDKILMYSPESPYKAYCYNCWWSDNWDPLVYARKYDFSRPFFEQYNDLLRAVPRLGIIQQGNIVNSDYSNRVSDVKNCYLIFGSANNEDCYYGNSYWDSKSSIDCYNIHKTELSYELIDCYSCNNLKYSQECHSCSNSSFLFDCRNCDSCFGCVNLRNKSYYIFNEKYSKEEYQEKLKTFDLFSRKSIEEIKKQIEKLRNKYIVPSLIERQTSNSTGNWLEECENVRNSYNCAETEDARYTFGMVKAKDVMDFSYWAMSSDLIYESVNVGRQCSNVSFSNECWDGLSQAQYCMNCHSSSDLFGCVGLRKKQYCILNKQYTKEEYGELVPKIIENMNSMPYEDKKKRTYKYGEFFPNEIVPFSYNETIAQEFFPLSKDQILEKGFRWREPDEKNYTITLNPENIPDLISEVGDSITKEVLGCSHAGKCNDFCTTAFKITECELNFYRNKNIPLPDLCPNCRHYERLNKRTPLRLWQRKCQCAGKNSSNQNYQNTSEHFHGPESCPNNFETSYSPERKETVYCKQCYNAEVV